MLGSITAGSPAKYQSNKLNTTDVVTNLILIENVLNGLFG